MIIVVVIGELDLVILFTVFIPLSFIIRTVGIALLKVVKGACCYMILSKNILY